MVPFEMRDKGDEDDFVIMDRSISSVDLNSTKSTATTKTNSKASDQQKTTKPPST